MADDAISTRRVNPYARPTDHRRLDELLDRWAVWIRAGGLEEFEVKAASLPNRLLYIDVRPLRHYDGYGARQFVEDVTNAPGWNR